VGAQLLHADRRTDTTKLIVEFSNFANAPKNESSAFSFLLLTSQNIQIRYQVHNANYDYLQQPRMLKPSSSIAVGLGCGSNSHSQTVSSYREQSASWEANRSVATKELNRILDTPVFRSCLCSQPLTPEVGDFRSHSHIPYIKPILLVTLSSHLRQGFPSDFFPSGFPTKTQSVFCSLPKSVSFSLVLSL
jgi:hypothetical protein